MENFDINKYYEHNPNDQSKDYIMQQTMMRIKDPKVSLDFYTKCLGMNLIWHADFPQWGFSLYFVGYCDKTTIPTDPEERRLLAMRTPGCVELTHNHGSEKNEGKVYNTGNADVTGTGDNKPIKGGFGHIGITVPDVYKTCEQLKEMGVEFQKTPNSGGMKGLAFVKDPDGYLIELLHKDKYTVQDVDCFGVSKDGGGYVDNSKK